jgi:hypothetical protein
MHKSVTELLGALQGVVEIDPSNLNDEFTNLPATVAWWSATVADLQAKVELAKLERKRVESETFKFRRAGHKSDGATAHDVATDPDVIEANTAEIAAEHELGHAKAIVLALLSKRDMLISLGANYRAESPITIR